MPRYGYGQETAVRATRGQYQPVGRLAYETRNTARPHSLLCVSRSSSPDQLVSVPCQHTRPAGIPLLTALLTRAPFRPVSYLVGPPYGADSPIRSHARFSSLARSGFSRKRTFWGVSAPTTPISTPFPSLILRYQEQERVA